MQHFNYEQLQLVSGATKEAQLLVSHYYVLAPREWSQMRYEVKTQTELTTAELLDSVLAQVICYEYTKCIGQEIFEDYPESRYGKGKTSADINRRYMEETFFFGPVRL